MCNNPIHRLFKISCGHSRFSTDWKNKEVSWDELVNQLQTTSRTHETQAEYTKMAKLAQDKIKDVGGFVGGWLLDGKRRSNTVVSRSLLTLDLDEAEESCWEDFSLLFEGLTSVCYSTHKHRPNKPRLRLIIPLDRDVTPDEYEAIARKLAQEIGIDQFDDTTYQPSRLMYWPSTSSDGQYFFKVTQGEALKADDYLAKYADWRNVNDWPVSSRQTDTIRKKSDKVSDPLTKEGVIGAFCRAYSIEDAINNFLTDIYSPGDRADRFTFAGGTTSNGLVVYDHKFAYSNHSTDPANGRLCNAFDLVRIHKFGELDKEINGATAAPSKLPSFKAMSEWARQLDEVKKQILKVKDESENWKLKLESDKQGVPFPTLNNFSLIISHDPWLKERIRMNELTHQPESVDELPWGYEGQLRDEDDAQLKRYIENNYNLYHSTKLQEAIICEADDHRYHPIKDYLKALPEWDGVNRVDNLLIDYLGADNTPYVKAVTRKTLVSAVARIMNPGCKFDFMLTLVGGQGIGKSSFIRALGGDWYIGLESGISGKESVEQLQGRWIVEVEELSSLKKAEVEQIKTYLSKQEEQVRMAYAHRTAIFKRQNIFIGTTNNVNFLRDLTGNRRFWVVDVRGGTKSLPHPDDTEERDRWREQIWAEALVLYKNGEKRYLDDPSIEQSAKEAQELHMEEDPWIGMIGDYINRKLPSDWKDMELFDRRLWVKGDEEGNTIRDRVCALEIWCECLDGKRENLTAYDANRINQIMDKMRGWERSNTVKKYGKLYGDQRGFSKIK